MSNAPFLSIWGILIILVLLLILAGFAIGAILLLVWLVRRGRPLPPPRPPVVPPGQSGPGAAKGATRRSVFVEKRSGKLRVRWGGYCMALVVAMFVSALLTGLLHIVVGGAKGVESVLIGMFVAVVAVTALLIYEFSRAESTRLAEDSSSGHGPPAGPPPSSGPEGSASAPLTCPRCGAPLPADAPQGLCPRCVLGVGLATHTDAPGETGPYGTKVVQPPPAPADIAGHFPQLEILECLGRGGMGVVYKARQPKLNRLVALKILAPEKGADPKFAERFLREAQALARLNHPNIVTVHDFGEADGLYYLLMEYVDGMTLRQVLQAHKMAPEEALNIVPKICDALQFAHELGVVHRDIKPENVLLDKQGRVKIADFGIAKIVGGDRPRLSLTEEQSVIGTPHYMAPEQVEKPQLVDHRADIYSLGVVFYEMLTGELPLGKFQPPSRKVQMDVRLDDVVLHALEKEPDRRYQHASDVKTAVETIATSPGASPAAAKPVERPVRILRWRDAWIWNWEYIQLLIYVPIVVVGLALPLCIHWWGLKALWLFAIELPFIGMGIMYAVVGHRVRGKQATLPRTTGEIAQCLMFRRPFESPGVAVLHEDRLELTPVVGSQIVIPLADILAVKEVRWFNGKLLFSKRGFVMDLADGRRVGVAVADVFGRRWRARLSRGALPELAPDAKWPTGKEQVVPADGGRPRLSRTALWGAIWAPLFFIVGVMFFTVSTVKATHGGLPPGPARWQIALSLTLLPLGVAAPFGTTILGCVAITQIRHSAGRLHGLGLAVFDALLFPLLALDGLIAVLGGRGLGSLAIRCIYPHITRESVWNELDPWGIALLVLVVIVALDVWIIRHLWRNVSAQPTSAPMPAGPAPAPHAASPWKTVAIVAAVAALAIPLGAVLLYQLQRQQSPGSARSRSYDSSRVDAVHQKLLAETVGLLKARNYRWDHLYVAIHYAANPDVARGTIEGLRKTVGAGLQNGSPVQLSDALSGGLDFRHQGKGLWVVRGTGDLANVTFIVDTSAEMGTKQAGQTTLPGTVEDSEAAGPGSASGTARVLPPAAPPPFAQAKPGEFKVALTNGVEFEVVAIASSPRSGTVWWRPDGTLLPEPAGNLGFFSTEGPGGVSRAEFAVLVRGAEQLLAEGNAVLAFDPQPQTVTSADLYKEGQLRSKVTVVGFREAPAALTCKLGLPDSPWKRLATWDQTDTLLSNESGVRLEFRRSRAGDETCLQLAGEVDLDRFELRLTARLKDGTYKNARIYKVCYGASHHTVTCALIKGLNGSDVIAYELYAAPLRWAAIPGIATRPTVPPIQGNPAASGAVAASSREVEHARRKFVRLVVDKAAMTFEGQPTTWEGVRALLERVTDRTNTVLECAVTSDQITVQQQNEWFGKCVSLANALGFEYASFIGIQRLGSKGTRGPDPASTGATGQLEFGPVVEQQLGTDWQTAECRVLDLDQGRLLSVPTNVVTASMNNPRPMLNWMLEHGADLAVTWVAPSETHLHLDDGVLLRLVGKVTFDSVAASTVRRHIGRGGGAQNVVITKAELATQPVFLYQTGEGGVGVLQILGLSQDSRGLRLRFKAVLQQPKD